MALSNKAKAYIRKHHKKKSAARIAKNLNLEESEVKAFINEISEPLPLKKKILFYSITFSIPVLFFLVLELSLRGVNYLGNTDLFLDPNITTEEYFIPNPNFASRYFFYTKTIPSPSTDVFLQQKPENAFRVFAMGGSSAAGYPYGFNGTFSRVVNDVLSDALPNQHVEVVNVATSAISTYTLYDQVDEILEQKPDAIMIYAGHNEFYGALGVGSNETIGGFPGFVRFYLKLQRFKTFLFLREKMVNTGQWFSQKFRDSERATGTLMQRIIRDQSIEMDGPVFELAMHQFRSNMEAIIQKFGKHDIPVYVSTIASNVKDQSPFISVDQESHPPADNVYKQALELYNDGNSPEAKKQFEYAKDLDGLKFRAPSHINQIIEEFGQEFEHVKIVPVHQIYEDVSPDGIIGNNLMLEHLHPNKTGYFLMGRTFAESMLSDLTDGVSLDLDSYFPKMFLTEFDDRIVYHRVRTLKQDFPFVTNGSVELYEKTYVPVNIVDSLAFEVVQNDKHWDEAKVEAGRYYQRTGETEKALLEFYGLIRNQPWNDSPYVFAARIFLEQNDFDNAEPLLRTAYDLFPRDAYTTKMLGAIELNKGNTEEAIRLLELSREMKPDDAQMLYNLSGAYGVNNEYEKALEIAEKVTEINPNFPGLRQWKQQLNQVINSRSNNR